MCKDSFLFICLSTYLIIFARKDYSVFEVFVLGNRDYFRYVVADSKTLTKSKNIQSWFRIREILITARVFLHVESLY